MAPGKQDPISTMADALRKALVPEQPAAPFAVEKTASQHELTVNGRVIQYTATVERLRVTLEDQPPADLFVVAYTLDGAGPERPVTFCFNGGPGSSSVWLHMGIFGPKRVVVDVDIPAGIPGHLEDNPLTLLTTTDLVFIDPASTGLSRPTQGKGDAYHGVKGDIASVGEAIHRWTTQNRRWGSPKYLAGESYGTIRAVGVARHLGETWGMAFNGLVLISVALKLGTLIFDASDNWLASAMLLPAAAVTAHYHGRVQAEDVWELHARATRFAHDRYVPALIRGDRATQAERDALSAELEALLGVSATFFQRCDNHLDLARFCAELLREERRTVGRLDSRFKGYARDGLVENLTDDPSFTGLIGVFTAGIQQQLAALGLQTEGQYRPFHRLEKWTFEDAENKPLDLSRQLRELLTHSDGLRVFVASGLYDLATPWAATEYTLAQLQLPADRRQHIVSKCYPAGHMMYLHPPSASALRVDLEDFFAQRA